MKFGARGREAHVSNERLCAGRSFAGSIGTANGVAFSSGNVYGLAPGGGRRLERKQTRRRPWANTR